MNDRDNSVLAVDVTIAATRESSYRDPSADEVLQVGIIAWLIFTGMALVVGFVWPVTPGFDVGAQASASAMLGGICGAVGFALMLAVGFPSGLALSRVLLAVRSRTLHVGAYGVMALMISGIVNVLFWGSAIVPLVILTVAPTLSTVAAWCIRWLR